ncbi:MAG: hypothetical protein ABR866_20225 [Candidatus Korobacteraceae bacterium]
MVLVLSILGVAVCAALAHAVGEELPAEVPAAWPLTQVAAQGGYVPDLRNRHLLGRLRHQRIFVLDKIGVDDLAERGPGANPQAGLLLLDVGEIFDPLDIDQVLRCFQRRAFNAVFDQAQQVATSGENGSLLLILRQKGYSLPDRGDSIVIEWFHRLSPSP